MKKEVLYIIIGIILSFAIFGVGYLIGTQNLDDPSSICPNWKDYQSLQNQLQQIRETVNQTK